MTKNKNKPVTSKTDAQKQLADFECKTSELKEKLARSLADYSNLQKRIETQQQLYATLATASIFTKIIDVLDDLYLAQLHLDNQGLQMTINKFNQVLKDEGLKEIDAEGKLFDPKTMDCVDVAPGKQDHVVLVKKKGYILNDHIIRPAQVVVGRETK